MRTLNRVFAILSDLRLAIALLLLIAAASVINRSLLKGWQPGPGGGCDTSYNS